MYRIWKGYFEDLHNMKTQSRLQPECGVLVVIKGGNYFRGEPFRRIEVEVRERKLTNGKPDAKEG